MAKKEPITGNYVIKFLQWKMNYRAIRFLSYTKRIAGLIVMFSFGLQIEASAQYTQTIKGTVVDRESKVSIPGAIVLILNTYPTLGNNTNETGNFKIEKVPVGRYDIKISFLGYEPVIIPEVLVTTGKEVVLNIELKESITNLSEVVIHAKSKDKPINDMSMVSARTFSVEEARRYAGGIDDPARLATAFAGVSAGSIENNGIVVRGNSPKGVLWRLEGADVPNPNHFGDGEILGGGFVCALSSQVLGNSDFLTGAFPAEYGNALSGVFDMKLRNGNNEKREYTFQAGMLGVDFAAEGPFTNGKSASYLFNYRYSTFSLAKFALPDLHDLPDYQDLTFKMNFPTQKAGTFSLWGFGGIDNITMDAITDSTKWEWNESRMQFQNNFQFGAIGLSHRYLVNHNCYINTTLTSSYNSMTADRDELDNNLNFYKIDKSSSSRQQFSLSFFVNYKFSPRHTNKAGITVNRLFYKLNINSSQDTAKTLTNYANDNGNSYLIQVYSQSKYDLNEKLSFTAGIHYQYFALNGNSSIEPRAAIAWKVLPRGTISFGFGNHSQTELLQYYLIRQNTSQGNQYPNKNLGFSKANHFVLGLDINITDNLRLKIEPYYQYLYDVPVIADSSFSMINIKDNVSLDRPLVNKGNGKNYGIDFTLERFLNQGLYYMITASVFNSKYKAGDGVEHNTQFNRNYTCNILGGKEWSVGKSNLLGINLRLYLMGGERYIPLNVGETVIEKTNVYNYYDSYSKQYSPNYRFDFTITYRRNHVNYSGIWALQYLNVFGSPDHNGFEYNYQSKTIKENNKVYSLPVLSYKIEF